MSPKNGFESFIHDHSSGFSALAQRPGRGNLYGRLCHGSSCFRSRRRRVQTSPTEGRMPSRKDLERSTSSARLFFTFRFPVFFHLAGLSKPRCKKSQICRQNHRSASRWQAPVPCFIPSPSNRTFGGYKRALSRIVDFLYSAGDEASKFAIRDCAGRSVQVVIGNRSFIVLMSLTTLTERSNWSNISPMF